MAAPTPSPKTALICGIGGQDGAYLTAHLLENGYQVVGTSRDAQTSRFEGLSRLGIRDRHGAHEQPRGLRRRGVRGRRP
ncbi:MAG: GDP-mannose 4,6-dehydratase [Planctomycetia bacterium]